MPRPYDLCHWQLAASAWGQVSFLTEIGIIPSEGAERLKNLLSFPNDTFGSGNVIRAWGKSLKLLEIPAYAGIRAKREYEEPPPPALYL